MPASEESNHSPPRLYYGVTVYREQYKTCAARQTDVIREAESIGTEIFVELLVNHITEKSPKNKLSGDAYERILPL